MGSDSPHLVKYKRLVDDEVIVFALTNEEAIQIAKENLDNIVMVTKVESSYDAIDDARERYVQEIRDY